MPTSTFANGANPPHEQTPMIECAFESLDVACMMVSERGAIKTAMRGSDDEGLALLRRGQADPSGGDWILAVAVPYLSGEAVLIAVAALSVLCAFFVVRRAEPAVRLNGSASSHRRGGAFSSRFKTLIWSLLLLLVLPCCCAASSATATHVLASDGAGRELLACDAGSYSNADGTACVTCPAGRYKEDAGSAASCTPCESPGEYTANTGSTTSADCQHCTEGEYGDLALGACAPCSISAEGSCILAFTEDLGEAYESAEVGDVIVLTPGTRYIGGINGCDNGDTSVCVTIAVAIKCSNTEEKCDLSGQSTRRIMVVETGEEAGSITLEGLSFEDGYSFSGGGAILFQDSSAAQVTASVFANNEARDGGGAILFQDSSAAQVIACAFANNEARDGGAIFFLHSSATIVTSTFTNNNSGSQGGAIFIDARSSALFLGFLFASNTATLEGGDVYNDFGEVEFASKCPAGHSGHKTGTAIGLYPETDSSYYGEITVYNVEGCDACPAGKYQDEEDRLDCKECGAGTYGTEQGLARATACTGCPKGKYSEYTGLSSDEYCEKCDAGKFGDEEGAASRDACKPCSAHELSNDSGTACMCGAGYYMRADDSCILCPPESDNALGGECDDKTQLLGTASKTTAFTKGVAAVVIGIAALAAI